jgi:hypothetical protein
MGDLVVALPKLPPRRQDMVVRACLSLSEGVEVYVDVSTLLPALPTPKSFTVPTTSDDMRIPAAAGDG